MRTTRRSLLTGAAAAAMPALRPAHAQKSSAISIALSARAPVTLNPQATTLGADNWACRQMYDTLVVPDDGTFAIKPEDFRPNLAEKWESSPDAKTWTFHLRKGCRSTKARARCRRTMWCSPSPGRSTEGRDIGQGALRQHRRTSAP